MNVLVTGGAGFIGSHIVDALLAAGHRPCVVDNLSTGRRENLPADVPLYEGDVGDRELLERVFAECEPEAVCHQAAQMSVSRSVREPAFDAQTNIVGLLQVLETSAKHRVKRFVFASSGGVLYGDVAAPATEDHPARPVSPYGISKWAGEEYLRFFAAECGLQSVALRYANVYGPRQNPHGEAGVVAIFCQKMLRGEAATIHGDGTAVRDYVYVGDVARANVLALTALLTEPFTPYNIGTGQPTDVNTLARELHARCASHTREETPAPVHGPARAGDLQSSLVNANRAAQDLGWSPQTRLTEGLGQTVAWFVQESPRPK